MRAVDVNDAIKGLEIQKKRKMEHMERLGTSITGYVKSDNPHALSVSIQNLVRVEQEFLHIQGKLEAYQTVQFQQGNGSL